MRWLQDKGRAIELWLGPAWTGFLQGFGAIVVLAAIFSALAIGYSLPDPPASLFSNLAQIGVGLLIAFSITIAGVAAKPSDEPKDHLNWLSFGAGIGVAGLLAVAAAVGLAAYRESDHTGAIDQIGVGFIGAALLILGLLVALLPYFSFFWRLKSN